MNPLSQTITNANNVNTNNKAINPVSQIMNTIRSGTNPQAMAEQILQNNPQASAMINMMKNQCGNSNPRDFVLNYCNQNGIDTNSVMQLANMLGIK
jgi:hypothetical protein